MYRKRKCFYLSTKQKEMQKWQIPILMHCSARTMPHGALRNSSAQEKGMAHDVFAILPQQQKPLAA